MLLATRSQDKLREIRMILGRVGDSLISLDDAGIAEDSAEDGIEAFETFRENALAKARHFAALTGLCTLADDSGLAVEALAGAPGVRSKRFSGADARGRELDDANNRELLRRLAAVPPPLRTAHYVCVAACVRPDAPGIAVVGTCAGTILAEPHGDGGFGYDPLFFVPALNATFAQVPTPEKNRQSHRARAFRALATILPPKA
jgi:XTP/dITP diphosphohydrolase